MEGFCEWLAQSRFDDPLLRGRSMRRSVGSMAEVDGHWSDLRNLAATTDMPQVGCVLSSTFSFRFYRDTFVSEIFNSASRIYEQVIYANQSERHFLRQRGYSSVDV